MDAASSSLLTKVLKMKGVFLASLLAAAAQVASAHYTFPYLIANGTTTGEYQYVRITANHYVCADYRCALKI
jgi:hypothetical protein